MAVSQIHTRSISLPSRLHPINSTEFEAQLDKLKSTVSLTSVDAIISGLVGLADLYNSIDTQAPPSLEDALERSVELLDCCSAIKEVAQMMRENIRALQSALRRKGSDSSALRNDVASYVASQKRMNKCIKKSVKALKSWEGRFHASDVYGPTAAVFRSALLFFSSSPSYSSSWNRVARLVLSKSGAHRGGVVVNEVGCVDLALCSGEFDKKMVKRSLQKLESCVDGIEEGLERMFRQLVRSRVNLLNILTNH